MKKLNINFTKTKKFKEIMINSKFNPLNNNWYFQINGFFKYIY